MRPWLAIDAVRQKVFGYPDRGCLLAWGCWTANCHDTLPDARHATAFTLPFGPLYGAWGDPTLTKDFRNFDAKKHADKVYCGVEGC